ncbi:MAG: SEL1-like repeat protein, partial [Rhizobiales bacterium]|nr:SEL1-like repeat protein [Hyphomicrobiales bacterium]
RYRIEIVMDLSPDRLIAEGGCGQLDIVLTNLLANAIDALNATEQPCITVRTWREESYVAVSVTDNGRGIPTDIHAEEGVSAAEFQYALYLMEGRVVPKDEKRATELMKAAADAGNRLAAFNYAQMLLEKDDSPKGMEKAYDYYEKAAEAGLADAQYAMSQAFANGVGGKVRNDKEARRWLLLAAHQNYDTAELELGTWLVEGRGGPADLEGGFRWLKQAAEGGNVAAENRLAKLYLNGIGTKADKVEAGAWYVLARRAGLSDPEMDMFFTDLSTDEQKQAIERANKLR